MYYTYEYKQKTKEKPQQAQKVRKDARSSQAGEQGAWPIGGAKCTLLSPAEAQTGAQRKGHTEKKGDKPREALDSEQAQGWEKRAKNLASCRLS